jgi:hypothetical protein
MDKKYFNTPSPAFSEFRSLMDKWDKHCVLQEQRDSISDLMDRHGLILFFRKGDDLYGSPEDSRVIFAKLKSGEDDDPMMPGFRDEARFSAINLLKALSGSPEESIENLFSIKDMPHIKVCDREDAIDAIMTPKGSEAKAVGKVKKKKKK